LAPPFFFKGREDDRAASKRKDAFGVVRGVHEGGGGPLARPPEPKYPAVLATSKKEGITADQRGKRREKIRPRNSAQ